MAFCYWDSEKPFIYGLSRAHFHSSLTVIIVPFSSLQKSAKKKDGAKKPLSGYMLFVKHHRPQVKEENPDLTFGGIGKELGKMWRELSDKEKQEWKDRKE